MTKPSLKSVDQLFCFCVVEAKLSTVQVTVDSNAVRYWDIQGLGLVVVLGSKGGLQPVVDVEAPRGVGLPQLVKLAQVPVCQTHAIGLTVFKGLDFPIVLTTVHAGIT